MWRIALPEGASCYFRRAGARCAGVVRRRVVLIARGAGVVWKPVVLEARCAGVIRRLVVRIAHYEQRDRVLDVVPTKRSSCRA